MDFGISILDKNGNPVYSSKKEEWLSTSKKTDILDTKEKLIIEYIKEHGISAWEHIDGSNDFKIKIASKVFRRYGLLCGFEYLANSSMRNIYLSEPLIIHRPDLFLYCREGLSLPSKDDYQKLVSILERKFAVNKKSLLENQMLFYCFSKNKKYKNQFDNVIYGSDDVPLSAIKILALKYGKENILEKLADEHNVIRAGDMCVDQMYIFKNISLNEIDQELIKMAFRRGWNRIRYGEDFGFYGGYFHLLNIICNSENYSDICSEMLFDNDQAYSKILEIDKKLISKLTGNSLIAYKKMMTMKMLFTNKEDKSTTPS